MVEEADIYTRERAKVRRFFRGSMAIVATAIVAIAIVAIAWLIEIN